MSVRAKFYVSETAQTTSGGRVKLQAVCRGEDNKAWASATPWGSIEMSIRNDLALEQFQVGREYFIDFTPVPEDRKDLPGME